MSSPKPAVLALEDGSIFRGRAFGADATIAGECVFNTSMTGYQEILTDPSYFGQIVTMTAPMIGNYGVNDEDSEADAPKCAGFVVRELSPVVSNWRSQSTLDDYLRKYGIPGISEIDTRSLTKKLRVDGAMKSCLSTLPISDEEAVANARNWQDMAGSDYVKEVTCKEPYIWRRRSGKIQRSLLPRRHHDERARHPGKTFQSSRIRSGREIHHLPQTRPPRL
jgi:carbamoyl-phosphate synthase small subunit